MISRRGSLGVVVLSTLVLALASSRLLSADSADLHGLVSRIIADQGVETIAEVDADSVPPKRAEELGRRVMGRLVGNDRWHEWLNGLMGGEGSPRLAELHRGLGRAYLERGGDPAEVRTDLDHGRHGPGLLGDHGRWFIPRMMLHRALVLRIALLLAALVLAVGAGAVLFRYLQRRRG